MILKLAIGMLGANCYVVFDQNGGEAAVVDPGVPDPAPLQRVLQEHQLSVRYLLNTHGHFDHIAGNANLYQNQVELGIHPSDKDLLLAGGGAAMFGLEIPAPPSPDLDLQDGAILELGKRRIHVLHTPGHTPGSISLHIPEESALLTGDTLFRGSVGRTDLPGGDAQALARSLRRIMQLPPQTRIYPGHGPVTTLSYEAAHSPWLRDLT